MMQRAGMVYNNFEIVHVPRFQAADIAAFNGAVDATMRIYSHRCAHMHALNASIVIVCQFRWVAGINLL